MVKWSDESYEELGTKVWELTQKWLAKCNTVSEVVKAVATEQLLNVMSEDVRIYVSEHKPKICTKARELAEDYRQARTKGKGERGQRKERHLANFPLIKCFTCGQLGHRSSECLRGKHLEEW